MCIIILIIMKWLTTDYSWISSAQHVTPTRDAPSAGESGPSAASGGHRPFYPWKYIIFLLSYSRRLGPAERNEINKTKFCKAIFKRGSIKIDRNISFSKTVVLNLVFLSSMCRFPSFLCRKKSLVSYVFVTCVLS